LDPLFGTEEFGFEGFGNLEQSSFEQEFTPRATLDPHQQWGKQSAPIDHGQLQSAQSYHPSGLGVQPPEYGSGELGYEQEVPWTDPRYGSQYRR